MGPIATDVKGQLESRGEPLGDWVMTPDECRSGQVQDFYGVDLHSSADTQLGVRIIRDPPRGDLVNVNIPGSDNRAVQFSADQCDRFDVAIERTSKSKNDIRLLDGHLQLDCKTTGGRIHGDITFTNCD